MSRFRVLLRNFGGIAFIVALLVGVTFLPPDTSLAEVQTAKVLKACVPPTYPPLVTGDPDKPGIDIELLRVVANRIGVSLLLSENRAMGRDFNPRNWALNRAQCQVIAGGVVDSQQTRSFLETGPSYAATGWVIVSPAPLPTLKDQTIGALTLVSGLDRIGLASFLRAQGATARVVTSPEALAEGIAAGTFAGGVTEAMLGAKLAADNGWTVAWTPPELARYNFVIGLWKGDITLKRAVDEAFAAMAADGTIDEILARYDAAQMN